MGNKQEQNSCRHPQLLVIEDEKEIRESLRQVLEFEGYEVFEAANGKEALELLTQARQPICLILLDLMMPVMDGWQFSELLKTDSAHNAIPVILVTAFSDKARGISSAGVVKKPFDLDALLSMVQRLCSCA